MAYVTYTAATPATLISLPVVYPCVWISPLATTGEKGTSRTAHPPPSLSVTADGCHVKRSRGAHVPVLLTPVVTQPVIPAACVAPRGYCVCVGSYQQPCVWECSVPAGSATCKATQFRELKGDAKKSRRSARPGNALDSVHVVRRTERSHSGKLSSAKRGNTQRHTSQLKPYCHEDAEDGRIDSSGYFNQEAAARRRTPAACSRSGHDFPRELCSAGRKQTADPHVRNEEKAQDVSTDYPSKGPQNPVRKQRNDNFQKR